LYNLTPRQFHNRLNGWREQQERLSLERWHQTRYIIAYTIPAGNWKKDSVPDIFQDMPLPGDPTKTAKLITISDEEMALRKYKLKKRDGDRFNDEFEALMRQYWRPDWGPHPDELEKPKTDAQPA